jgi:hypothetical protein
MSKKTYLAYVSYGYTYVRMYVCIYVCAYVCMYIWYNIGWEH